MDLAWLIFRNYLFTRRSGALVRIIAWHCLIGVGMGVAALLIVLSVMNGFNITIRNRMLSFEPHLVLPSASQSVPADATHVRRILNEIAPGEIVSVERFETQDLILRSGEGAFGGALAKGYDRTTLQN